MANINPLVSVIIPCYNQACFLPDAIASLLKQSLQNWECIIVNDGSKDNTADVAEKLASTDNRISVINQANKGLSGARNSGLTAAKGEMLQFLDADDILEPDKLKIQAEFLHANPSIDVIFGDARYFSTENPELRSYGPYAIDKTKAWIPELWHAQGTLLEKLLIRNLFPVNCPLVRNTVFKQVGNWNEDLEALEDWEFWFRCAAANIKIEFLNTPNTLALIRMHSASMTNDSQRIIRSAFKMRATIGPLITNPALRIKNFETALHSLKSLEQKNKFNLLLKLAYSSGSLVSFFKALFFYITEINNKPFTYIAEKYKNITPWPIQKLIVKLYVKLTNQQY